MTREISNEEIEKLMRRLGLSGVRMGYHYWVYGIACAIRDEEMLQMLLKRFYPAISENFAGTNPESVERAMRLANEYIWREGNRRLLEQIAGHKLVRKPTNLSLIHISEPTRH